MISIIINADTRPGQDAVSQTVGDHGEGSLQGVRSWDFLTELPRTAEKFFLPHNCETVLYVDEVDPIPVEISDKLDHMEESSGCRFKWSSKKHDHSQPRWNDRIYLEALQGAKGDYVVHLDQDCALFRSPDNDIVARYLKWLDEGYRFICQSTNLTKEQHGMWWASTRFFMCKRETLDFTVLWKTLEDRNSIFSKYPWEDGAVWMPCLEHALGVMGGKDKVLYPPREDGPDGYTIFSWVVYYRGLLELMNNSTYEKVQDFVFNVSGGLCGPSDFIPRFPL